jgi:hypothetical protein
MPRGKPALHYRWIRKKEGLWIPYRKRTYLYWFKFLQEAQMSDEHEVQWKEYRGWGGPNEVLGTKFDDWWDEHWKQLFGCKERNEKSVRFDLTTIRPKTETIRANLFAWRARNTPPDWTPRNYVAVDTQRKTTETKRRGGRNLAIARKMVQLDRSRKTPIIQILDPDYEYSEMEETEIQSRVGRYLRGARKTLMNVCEGHFP